MFPSLATSWNKISLILFIFYIFSVKVYFISSDENVLCFMFFLLVNYSDYFIASLKKKLLFFWLLWHFAIKLKKTNSVHDIFASKPNFSSSAGEKHHVIFRISSQQAVKYDSKKSSWNLAKFLCRWNDNTYKWNRLINSSWPVAISESITEEKSVAFTSVWRSSLM